jgi:hypothetical protein
MDFDYSGLTLWLIICVLAIGGYYLFKWMNYSEKRKRENRLKQGIKINRTERKIKDKKPIYSLELGKEISGGFVLGTGGINDELKYYFYVDKEGGKQIESVDADSCVLIEEKGKPRIKYFEYEDHEDYTIENEMDENIEAFLYVPKNTIKRKFDGSLK